ncbi:MAG: cardiolipin synthase [Clostridia bacterium]|nr:cardiolipin synthase [Clostridia bacterium]
MKEVNNEEKSIMKKNKKKGEKKRFVTILKIASVIILFLIQIAFMLLLYTTGKGIYKYARVVYEMIKIGAILYLLYRHDSSAYKISWILFITFMPVVGLIVFFLWGNSKLRKKKELEIRRVRVETENMLRDSDQISEEIAKFDKFKANQVKYTTNITGYPVYRNQGVQYFSIGEEFFQSLKKDLQKAEKYILVEFYIIAQGKLYDEIFEILKAKVREGVRVQLIVDSLGAMFRFPKNVREELEEEGIEIYVFNKLSAPLSGYINYRDHRKIVVIDGVCSYTGGVNLADEYANIIERFGHWKDVGIKITGEATWSFTLMFLRALEQMTEKEIDYEWYQKIGEESIKKWNLQEKKQGYVLPCADGPDNRKNPIESIYIQTINYAKDYIYITTPYFVISEALLTALLNSARSGVDVRIILPHIPDKKMVQRVTRSYYEVLLEAGIKVYEYKPGFIHSKTFVADDNTAIVGTANLDFRSMHLNFECINWMYQTGEEMKVKQDFEEMLKNCIEIDLNEWKKRSIFKKVWEAILTAFAPMM